MLPGDGGLIRYGQTTSLPLPRCRTSVRRPLLEANLAGYMAQGDGLQAGS